MDWGSAQVPLLDWNIVKSISVIISALKVVMMTSLMFVVHYEAYIISLSDFKVSFDWLFWLWQCVFQFLWFLCFFFQLLEQWISWVNFKSNQLVDTLKLDTDSAEALTVRSCMPFSSCQQLRNCVISITLLCLLETDDTRFLLVRNWYCCFVCWRIWLHRCQMSMHDSLWDD